MGKKHKCMSCGNKKKIKKMQECCMCEQLICAKCFNVSNNSCYDCYELAKIMKLQRNVNRLVYSIECLKDLCEKTGM